MRPYEDKRKEKEDNGLEDRVVAIKRVTKVVKGGRNMRFSALVVVGDGNGHVGAGLGKAAEIPEAIRKGKEDAMKHMISVARTDFGSITHDNIGKYCGAQVKSLGSNNKQNVVFATLAALKEIKTPEEVARLRGKTVEEILA